LLRIVSALYNGKNDQKETERGQKYDYPKYGKYGTGTVGNKPTR
jgi:hypothetical protein